MNLLFLPGNSKQNLAWSRDVAEGLRKIFSVVRVVSYHHWDTGAPYIDMQLEKRRVTEFTHEFSPYVLLAKSIGVLFALDCIRDGIISPESCIFLGTPVDLAKRLQYPLEQWLKGYSTPTLWIQKDEDPACKSRVLSDVLKSADVQMATFLEIPGNSHHYELSEVSDYIEQYVQG